MGMIVSLLGILWINYRNPFYAEPHLSGREDSIRIRFAEDVSFLNKAGLMRTLSHLPPHLHVVLDASHTRRMHPDVAEVIDDFIISSKSRDIEVEYLEMPDHGIDDHAETVRQLATERAGGPKKSESDAQEEKSDENSDS